MVRRKDFETDEWYYCGSIIGEDFRLEHEQEKKERHDEKYESHKQRAKERQQRLSEEGREIGPLPQCADPELVSACREDLRRFMLTFGNDAELTEPLFPDPFCDAQEYAISAVQETLLHGGDRPLCLPRGFAKTTICEWGIAWALVYGHQKFILIIGAKLKLAQQILANVKWIMGTSLFSACFPELCYPIERLEQCMGRAPGQTLNGIHTNIKSNSDILVCPTVEGSPSSGSIVTTSGLDGAIRGLKYGPYRPTAIVIDDPQTEKSAESVTQTEKRWNLLSGCIKGLGGRKTRLAMIATITVQRPDDLSEKILKEWGGRRFSMLRSLPKNMELWEEYNTLRKLGIHNFQTTEEQIRQCTDFYIQHRAEMDEGAEAEWPTSFQPGEISAIQNAMNKFFEDKKTFFAEYQNRPLAVYDLSHNLKFEEITAKIIQLPRYEIPLECERVTAGIDIQQDCLYWVVTSWGTGFRGHVMDYGRYPDGNATIQTKFPGVGEKDAFYLALMDLLPKLGDRVYERADGTRIKTSRILIDANRGLFTPQVRRSCFDLSRILINPGFQERGEVPEFKYHEGLFEPVFGWGKGDCEEFVRGLPKPGEERGDNWQRLPRKEINLVRHTRYDTNYWKSNVRTFWQAPLKAAGSLTLFRGDEVLHWTFIQHQLSEKSEPFTGTRGTIDKWTMTPNTENHLWDCLIMATVAEATLGGSLESGTPAISSETVSYTADWLTLADANLNGPPDSKDSPDTGGGTIYTADWNSIGM
ncbi:MAG: phage terminase large subunit family protein [Thermoguttaceae bacterium]|nr:phage terminase large subunit family protein [Thermoguttaceae bacterium]